MTASFSTGVLRMGTGALATAPLGGSRNEATAVAPPVPWLWAGAFVVGLALLVVGLRRPPEPARDAT